MERFYTIHEFYWCFYSYINYLWVKEWLNTLLKILWCIVYWLRFKACLTVLIKHKTLHSIKYDTASDIKESGTLRWMIKKNFNIFKITLPDLANQPEWKKVYWKVYNNILYRRRYFLWTGILYFLCLVFIVVCLKLIE